MADGNGHPTLQAGALRSIESIEDIPKRIIEAIFEGLAKEPSKWMVMAFGFYLGWKGIDVFKYFMNILNDLVDVGGEILKDLGDAAMDMAKIIVLPSLSPVSFLLGMFGSIVGPVKPKDPDAGVESAPAGSTELSATSEINKGGKGFSAPVARTSEEIAAAVADPDDSTTTSDAWAHELEVRMIAGAMGAIAAVMVTQPGFFAGLGEIVKGVGEIVPL